MSTVANVSSDRNALERPTLGDRLWRDLILPTLLFTALGGMTWAVRGCSGFGAVVGCTFAGVMWGTAWWYLAQDPRREQSRRYASGWIILALTAGIGLSGARGWMQWPNFFEGRLSTNYAKGEFLPISRFHGFLWLFIAGVPWAGIGACLLAWCGSRREIRVWHWVFRIFSGIGGGLLAWYLYETFPQYFLPLYEAHRDRYQDMENNPTLKRLLNDCRAAVTHMGYYLGFLAFEVIRREWKNVVLILTVGLVNGVGWALCQNWSWAKNVWPTGKFNWWRCWESSGGISIGIAYGIAYFLVNRPMDEEEHAAVMSRRSIEGPNFEWLLVYTGLAYLLSVYYLSEMQKWGPWYFSTALLFGLVYYLVRRRKPAGEIVSRDPSSEVHATSRIMTTLVAVLVVGATIAGHFPEYLTFLPSDKQQAVLYIKGAQGAVLAIGLLWYWLNRAACDAEKDLTTPIDGDPNLERFGVYAGLLLGLGISIRSGSKGWFNIYRTDQPERFWSGLLWDRLGPVFLVLLVAIALWVLFRPRSRLSSAWVFPHAYGVIWLVLLIQNAIALAVTGPLTEWSEAAFAIYYLLLFLITAVIVFHEHTMKSLQRTG